MGKMNLIILITSFILWFSCTTANDSESEVVNENEIVPKEDKSTFTYLALGDSYTIGHGVDESQRFPVQLVNKLNEAGKNVGKPTIVARTGWTTGELEQ